MAMSGHDRVLCALEGRIPDRVPTMEMYIDPKVVEGICPGMSVEDFVEHADIDGVTCLTMVEDPADIEWIDRGKGLWRDKWGALQHITEDAMSVIMPPARIGSLADLQSYVPPDPLQAPVIAQARRLVEKYRGNKAVAVVGEVAFAPSQYLRAGLANLMMDYVLDPELVRRLAAIGLEYHVELYRKLLEEGVRVFFLGDDYAGKTGTFMSPAHFEQYILPSLRTIVDVIHQGGGYCIKHTDGDIWGILDMLIGTGLDMLGPLEPAYMALDEVRRHSGGKVGVMGNADVDVLGRGTTDEVREVVREQLRRISPLGGHILSSANTISSAVRPENYAAMLETLHDYGKYPIRA